MRIVEPALMPPAGRTYGFSPRNLPWFWRFLPYLLGVLLAVWGIGALNWLFPFTLVHSLIVIPSFLLGIVVVYLPIGKRYHVWFSATTDYAPFDPDRTAMFPAVLENLRETIDELTPKGFIVKAHLWDERHSIPVLEFVTVLENAGTGEVAKLATMYRGKKPETLLGTSFMLYIGCTDGSALVTTNQVPLVRPTREQRTQWNFPSVREVKRLYRLHRQLCHGYKKPAQFCSPMHGSTLILCRPKQVKSFFHSFALDMLFSITRGMYTA